MKAILLNFFCVIYDTIGVIYPTIIVIYAILDVIYSPIGVIYTPIGVIHAIIGVIYNTIGEIYYTIGVKIHGCRSKYFYNFYNCKNSKFCKNQCKRILRLSSDLEFCKLTLKLKLFIKCFR